MNYKKYDVPGISKQSVLQARSGFRLDFIVHDVCHC